MNKTSRGTEEDETQILRIPQDPTATFNRGRTMPPQDLPPTHAELRDDSASSVTLGLPPRETDGALSAPDAGVNYRLHRLIGVGGMGEVWEAEQRSLSRLVAVKRLAERRRAMAGDDLHAAALLREEFRREALIAARLEHPNIVPVHDRAIDAEGQPLLAMKRVHGRPWSESLRLDFNTLPEEEYLRKHLAILSQMGLAVAFAHSRGIVHRDLKPSQVMVGDFGEVLLMDWGLAFFVGEDPKDVQWVEKAGITTRESATNPSGTVAFMAPEQTEYSGERLGTWTDVYLLGSTLYYVLTGTHPHESLAEAREGCVDPPAQRAPDRRIPRELEAICLRAMARRPEERFESAQDFLDALEAYRSGDSRRAESLAILDRLRHQVGTLRDYTGYSQALSELQRARQLWPTGNEADEVEAELLAGHAKLALDSGDLKLASVLLERMPTGAVRGALQTRLRDLESAQARREGQRRRLMLASGTFLALLLVLAGAFIGHLERSRRSIEAERNRAVAAERESARQRQEALAARDRAQEAQFESDTLVAYMLVDLYQQLKRIGQVQVLDSATKQVEEALSKRRERGLSVLENDMLLRVLLQISEVRRSLGDNAGAERVLKEAVNVAAELVEAEPSVTQWKNGLATALGRLGLARQTAGDGASAEELYRRELAIMRDAVAAEPESARWQMKMTYAMNRLGDTMRERGAVREALAMYEDSLAIAERLSKAAPDDTTIAEDLGVALGRVAGLLSELGEHTRAIETQRRSLAVSQRLADADSRNVPLQHKLAVDLMLLGDALSESGDNAGAREAYDKLFDIAGTLIALDGANQDFVRLMATASSRLGTLAEKEGNYEDALALHREDLRLSESLAKNDPANVRLQIECASTHRDIGRLLRYLKRYEEALESFDRAVALLKEAVDRESGSFLAMTQLAFAQNGRGDVLESMGRSAEALAAFEASLAIMAERAVAEPDLRMRQEHHAVGLCRVGLLRARSGRVAEGFEATKEALDKFIELEALESETNAYEDRIAACRADLAQIHRMRGDLAAARAELAAALPVLERTEPPDSVILLDARQLAVELGVIPGGS